MATGKKGFMVKKPMNASKWEKLVTQDTILLLIGAVVLFSPFIINFGVFGIIAFSLGCGLILFTVYDLSKLMGKSYIETPTE
jgi:hypothetical protein